MALRGFKVIELAGLAPVPMCGMILADFGARVIKVENPKAFMNMSTLDRGKESIMLDLSVAPGREVLRRLCSTSDVLIDPNRPNVLSKLNLGSNVLHAENPRLIIAHLTGYGQPSSNENCYHRAGHDINFLALSGLLSRLGLPRHFPQPPVNILGDFAGGSALCALGIVMALLERERQPRELQKGKIIDSSITDGVAYLGSFLWTSQRALPFLTHQPRGCNMLDGGGPVHFYRCYETKDNKFMAVGAVEPKFYQEFLNGIGLTGDKRPEQFVSDARQQTQIVELIEKIFRQKTQEEWRQIFDDVDACVTPVMGIDEVHLHPVHQGRRGFMRMSEGSDVLAPRPAPRIVDPIEIAAGKQPANETHPPTPQLGEHTEKVLRELGYSEEDIKILTSTSAKL